MVALACDHGGFSLMQEVKTFLQNENIAFKDFGTYSAESCDYPDFAIPAANTVVSGECDKGIFICTMGIGMSIIANKVPGIRAALCTDNYMAEMSRRHNDANVLCIGAHITYINRSLEIIKVFLDTGFDGERHLIRMNKVNAYDKSRK